MNYAAHFFPNETAHHIADRRFAFNDGVNARRAGKPAQVNPYAGKTGGRFEALHESWWRGYQAGALPERPVGEGNNP